LAVDAKRSDRSRFRDLTGIQTFLSRHPRAAGRLPIHGGREIRRMGENILAIPWPLITGAAIGPASPPDRTA